MDAFQDVKHAASIEEYAADHLTAKGGRGWYECPNCHSGERPGGTPAFHLWGNHGKVNMFKCFSCGISGDVFDLAGIVNGTDDKAEELKAVAEWAHVTVSELPRTFEAKPAKPAKPKKPTPEVLQKQEKAKAYVSAAYQAMSEGCAGWNYLIGRGLTGEQIERWHIGWDAAGQRVVIPWGFKAGTPYYVARDVTGAAEHKYLKPSGLTQPVFNPDALNEPAVFIVEGIMDALAIEALGYPAIALMSTGSGAFKSLIKSVGYGGMVAVMLDADNPGQEAAERLADDLAGAGIRYAPLAQLDGCKDAGDAIEAGRAAELSEHLQGFIETFDTRAAAEKEARYGRVLDRANVIDPFETVAGIYELSDERKPVPTGIRGVDVALGGGLPVGLTALGAISSMGKTSLIVQMADNIAASGRPVLFVTIEQTARELTAKSLSRYMAAAEVPFNVSAADVCSSAARAGWGEAEYTVLNQACTRYYEQVAANLRYMEPAGQPSVEEICTVAAAMAEHDGQPPVVFIDYLQLLRPGNPRMSDKQAVDENVMALRQMAGRTLKTPVVIVSSLNRSSYSGTVSLESFKESGAIEYGSDVLLGLQPAGMEDELDGVPEAKVKATAKKKVRSTKTGSTWDVELLILKNRSGRTYDEGVPLTFTPRTSTFTSGHAARSRMQPTMII